MTAAVIRLDLLRPRLRLVSDVPRKNTRHGANRTGEKDAGNVVAKTTRKTTGSNLSIGQVRTWMSFPVELSIMLRAVVANRLEFHWRSGCGLAGAIDYEPTEDDLRRLDIVADFVEQTARSADCKDYWDGVRRASNALMRVDGIESKRLAVLASVKRVVGYWRETYWSKVESRDGWEATVRNLRQCLVDLDPKFRKIDIDNLRSMLEACSETKTGGRGKLTEIGIASRLLADCKALKTTSYSEAKKALDAAKRRKAKPPLT